MARRLGIAFVSVLLLGSASGGCEWRGPNSDEQSPSGTHTEVDLSRESCDSIGREELLEFFAANQIEVRSDDPDLGLTGESTAMFCAISVTWGADYNEEPADVNYRLRVFDTEVEAEEAIANPGFLSLTPIDRRPADSRSEGVSTPWSDGFVWTTTDATGYGITEAAVRMRNIVVVAEFGGYIFPAAGSCTGTDCGVPPSELATWLHETYLPTVGEHVQALLEA